MSTKASAKTSALKHIVSLLALFTVVFIGPLLIQTTTTITTTVNDEFFNIVNEENRRDVKENNVSSSFQLDIISIGSINRPQYQQTQRDTFASHTSVRHFFAINELDDFEPNCTQILTWEDVESISRFCHSKVWRRRQFLMRHLRGPYASVKWLSKKTNPQGWMCAQVRPSFGWARAVDYYRKQQKQSEAEAEEAALPDWIIIMDDDSYINVQLVQDYLQQFSPEPRAIAGCMVRSAFREANFTIPFGGFGMLFNRAAIQNFMRPIRCSKSIDNPDPWSLSACSRLKNDQLGEHHLFEEGMSVTDLMAAYARFQPYTQYSSWNTGFCVHSDWLWGFWSNFYNISRHVDDPVYSDVPHARMDGYNESEFYVGRQTAWHAEHRRICNNEYERCYAEHSHICHYQTPEQMTNLTEKVKRQYPESFRTKAA